MLIIQFVLIAVEVVVSLLLLILILMQRAKNEGLGLAFGAGVGEALFGSRAGNILTKLTIVFAVVFMVNTTLLSVIYSGYRGRSLMSRFGISPMVPMTRQPMSQGGQRGTAQQPAGTQPKAAGGAPTLPGANLEDKGVPAAAPSEPTTPSAAAPAEPTEAEPQP
jgi:preprotein translocase subunit SecG